MAFGCTDFAFRADRFGFRAGRNKKIGFSGGKKAQKIVRRGRCSRKLATLRSGQTDSNFNDKYNKQYRRTPEDSAKCPANPRWCAEACPNAFRTFEATNDQRPKMTAVGFEPTPLRNGALSHRLRPLSQTVLPDAGVSKSKRNCSGLLCVPAHSVHDIDAILDHNITSEG